MNFNQGYLLMGNKMISTKIIILAGILCTVSVTGSSAPGLTGQKEKEPSWVKNIPAEKVLEWRRHIHQNPELSFEEKATSEYVDSILRSFGNIEVIRPTPTSVVGILRGGEAGSTVAFRADMDALPVTEETGLHFASKVEGVSHVCGHDTHTAMLLGTAATLSSMQSQVKGTVYFIFQHAEEKIPGGSREIIDSGVLNDVRAFFGMHVFPYKEAGCIGILPVGPASTAADAFYLTIQGKGSHGSKPDLAIDPIVTGAEIVTTLQTIVSRNVPPGEMAVISVGKFQSGTVSNVIPEKAILEGTVRSITESTRQLLAERIMTIIDNIVKANGATYTLDYQTGYPAIENDEALIDLARASAKEILGSDKVFDAPRMTASEDFAKYREIAPICFLTLGTGPGFMNHHPAFNPDESSFINGVKVEVQVILNYLAQQ
jgi:amidohydrolase